MTTDECRYEFDPASWEAATGRLATPAAEPWSCRREPVDGSDRCLFHLPPEEYETFGVTSEAVRKRFVSELDCSDEDTLRLIGARLDVLDLSHAVLDARTNRPIDLSHARIGRIDADHAVIRQPLRFDEATIGGPIDLSSATLTHPVELRQTVVDGPVRANDVVFEARIDWSDARFDSGVSFERATFGDVARFPGATFHRDVVCDDVEFDAEAEFGAVRFCAGVSFSHASFRKQADFRDATFGSGTSPADEDATRRGGREDSDQRVRFTESEFGREALFGRATFEGDSLFKKVNFGGDVHFQTVRFGGEASFSGATFEAGGTFRSSTFADEASISYVDFRGSTSFPGVEFEDYCSFYESSFADDADFRDVTYADTARYMNASFGRRTYFDRARFEDTGDFGGVEFGNRVQFVRTRFEDRFDAVGTTIENGRFERLDHPGSSRTVDLSESHFESGRIVQTTGDEVHYDFTDSVLGDVTLQVDGSDGSFDRLRIYRTTFDGFDFSEHRSELAPEWRIHSLGRERRDDRSEDGTDARTSRDGPGPPMPDDEGGDGRSRIYDVPLVGGLLDRRLSVDASELERTYLNAKNGASDGGDDRAASAFFVHEMKYRRRTHLASALAVTRPWRERLYSGARWLTNVFMGVTCGFGERPQRTLVAAVVFVVVYAGVFAALLPDPPYGTALGYFVLSVESFTTLVMGGGPAVSDPIVRLIADVEGFIGAFFVGLFVFTLTRSVHR